MAHVIAVTEHEDDGVLLAGAAALARMLGVDLVTMRITDDAGADQVARVVEVLESPETRGGALRGGPEPSLAWDVITRVSVPMLLVPHDCVRVAPEVRRVLVPLDGAVDTTKAVGGLTRRAQAHGAEVSALHVFDSSTVPAFWDQAAHSATSWSGEFISRHLPPGVSLYLRSGTAEEEVMAAVRSVQPDLVLIAWHRDLRAGHGAVVRRCVVDGTTPVLMVVTNEDLRPRNEDLPHFTTGATGGALES